MQEQIKTQCTRNVFEVIYIALKKDRKFFISPKGNKEGILKEVKFEAKIYEDNILGGERKIQSTCGIECS